MEEVRKKMLKRMKHLSTKLTSIQSSSQKMRVMCTQTCQTKERNENQNLKPEIELGLQTKAGFSECYSTNWSYERHTNTGNNSNTKPKYHINF